LEDLALQERLDATMDKAIRRWAQAKALKQLSGLSRRRPDKLHCSNSMRKKDDTRNDSN
jgi:hypothetical protein